MLLPPRMFEITAAAKTTMMKLVFMSSSATHWVSFRTWLESKLDCNACLSILTWYRLSLGLYRGGAMIPYLLGFITQRNKNTIIVEGWLGVSQEPGNDSTDAVRDRRQTRARPMLVRVNLYSLQLYLPGRAHVEKPCELEIKCRNSISLIPFSFSFLTEVLKHKPENLLGNLHVKCRFFFWKKNLDSI